MLKWSVIAGVAFSWSEALAAQNLISNPDFDVDVLQWFHDTSVNQLWSSDDADTCPLSGSLSADSVETTPGFFHFSTRAMDLIPVSPGEEIFVQLDYRSDAALTRLYLTYCSDPGGTTCVTFSPYLAFAGPTASWTTLSGSQVIPAGVGAVFFSTNASSGTAAFAIELDRAYLGRSARILSDDLEGGSVCRWSSAVGTIP
jgi:hypothetical protein